MAPVPRLRWAIPALLVALLGLLWHRRQRRGRPGPPDNSHPPLQATPQPATRRLPADAAAGTPPSLLGAQESGSQTEFAERGDWAPRQQLRSRVRSRGLAELACENQVEELSELESERGDSSAESEQRQESCQGEVAQHCVGDVCNLQNSKLPTSNRELADKESKGKEHSESEVLNKLIESVESHIEDIAKRKHNLGSKKVEEGETTHSPPQIKREEVDSGLKQLSEVEVDIVSSCRQEREAEGVCTVTQVEKTEAASSLEQARGLEVVKSLNKTEQAEEICQLKQSEIICSPKKETQAVVSSPRNIQGIKKIGQLNRVQKSDVSEVVESCKKEKQANKDNSLMYTDHEEAVSSPTPTNLREVIHRYTVAGKTEVVSASEQSAKSSSLQHGERESSASSSKRGTQVEEICSSAQEDQTKEAEESKVTDTEQVNKQGCSMQEQKARGSPHFQESDQAETSNCQQAEELTISSLIQHEEEESCKRDQAEVVNSCLRTEDIGSQHTDEAEAELVASQQQSEATGEEGSSCQQVEVAQGVGSCQKVQLTEEVSSLQKTELTEEVSTCQQFQQAERGNSHHKIGLAAEVSNSLQVKAVEEDGSHQQPEDVGVSRQQSVESNVSCHQAEEFAVSSQQAEQIKLVSSQQAEEIDVSSERTEKFDANSQQTEQIGIVSSQQVEDVEVNFQQAVEVDINSQQTAEINVSSEKTAEFDTNSQQTERIELVGSQQAEEVEINSQQAVQVDVSNLEVEQVELVNSQKEVEVDVSSQQADEIIVEVDSSKQTERGVVSSYRQVEELEVVNSRRQTEKANEGSSCLKTEEEAVGICQPSYKTETPSSDCRTEEAKAVGSQQPEQARAEDSTMTEQAAAAAGSSVASAEAGSPVRVPAGAGVARAMSGERDSANHSPAEGMLGSSRLCRCSDVQSEDSSDSGKGCSDAPTPASRTPASGSSEVGDPPGELASELVVGAPLVYEFVLPQHLVGRLIGRHGCFVHQIKAQTNASILIKRHPDTPRLKVCAVEGSQADVETAMDMIRHKFPQKRYPNVTLEQVCFVPPVATVPMLPDCLRLQLVEGISNDVILSSLVTPAHFFLQQPTHPTYPALARLCACMNATYSESAAPLLPAMNAGMVAAAPVMGGWYRAEVVAVEEQEGTCQVRYVDFGGYEVQPCSALRQIRADFMTLPFQAAECYLANVVGTGEGVQWSSEALAVVEELTAGQVLQAQVCGYSEDGVPAVCLYAVHGTCVVPVNRELVMRGLARWWEPQAQPELQ